MMENFKPATRLTFYFYGLLVFVLLLPSLSFAAQVKPVQSTIGSTSQSCVLSGKCNNVDLVQAQLITQDVIVYGVACFLFFFGFQVGMSFMLGPQNRQGA